MIEYSSQVMRFLLVLCTMAIMLIAMIFLRQRHLPFKSYLGWGLLAVLLPLVGPFVVLLVRPGLPRP